MKGYTAMKGYTTTPEHQQSTARAFRDKSYVAPVPCGSCHKCCTNRTVIVLMPQVDDPNAYRITWDDHGNVVLQHKPNGDCTYLEDGKCSIHGNQPFVCRGFDCRHVHLDLMANTRNERRQIIREMPDLEELADQGRDMIERHGMP
jgi:Fe-S-cluster containining protein